MEFNIEAKHKADRHAKHVGQLLFINPRELSTI